MNVLSNLPLECFEPRSAFSQRLLTFGPRDRMWVDGTLFPFDVEFDPARGSWAELASLLPADFTPDVVLFYWPDQEPLPAGLETCPHPVVGVVSDYNLTLPYTAGLWPFFDLLLVDTAGVELFERLSFADVRAFCQFSFKPWHRLYPEVARDLDLAFAGNLHPVVQRERAPWIERLLRLGESDVSCEVRSGLFGEDYGRFLNRARIGFNRSIRGEMNLRSFEVPACGAVLLMERENLEVRDYLEPGEEVVLYGPDDFEQIVRDLLADPERLDRIARAGHHRVTTDHRMGKRLDALERMLATAPRGRAPSTAFDRALGRGLALLSTWAPRDAAMACFAEASDLAREDPRPLNGMALAMLHSGSPADLARAAALLGRACSVAPGYVPSALNLGWLMEAGGRHAESMACKREVENRLANVSDWTDLDGPVMPGGFSPRGLAVAGGLRESVLAGDVRAALAAWSP